MIKKLRNKILLMNMVSTFCLILIAFSIIYAITYNHAEQKIEQSLFRAFAFHRPIHLPSAPDSGKFREFPSFSEREEGQKERELKDLRNFSVFVDSEGNVNTDSILGENNEHYGAVVNTALSQNSQEGEFSSEGIVWRFVSRKLKNNAKIIALVDISAEKALLRQLVISFAMGALILLFLIYIISLKFANRAVKPVADAWDKQKQFVADASHELKTPLAAINTNIDVLMTKRESTIKEEEKWLRYVKTEVKRLSELSGSLLLLARMDSGVQVEKEYCSISEIIEETILNLEAVAYEKGVKLEYDIEKEVAGNINSSQIARLCLILLDNAIKYSPKGECVDVSFKKSGREQAELRIKNWGEVIDESDIDKIFDRFYRADKSRSTSGYGLGLAIAKEIVEIHKGKISVQSLEATGTEFIVPLPV